MAARGFRDRAARCTRPACPLIGRAAVSMVISRKARPPPRSSLPPPPPPQALFSGESSDRQVNKTGAA